MVQRYAKQVDCSIVPIVLLAGTGKQESYTVFASMLRYLSNGDQSWKNASSPIMVSLSLSLTLCNIIISNIIFLWWRNSPGNSSSLQESVASRDICQVWHPNPDLPATVRLAEIGVPHRALKSHEESCKLSMARVKIVYRSFSTIRKKYKCL